MQIIKAIKKMANGVKNISINKKNAASLRILIGVAAALLSLGILNLFDFEIKNFFHLASYPIEKNFWHAGQSTSEFLGSILNSRGLMAENENLKEENQKLLSQVIFLQAIKKANKAQSDISAAYQDSGFEFIMAWIIGLDSQDELTVNKGSEDGVIEGMPVINQQKVLFGEITEVYKNFSKITLISNKNSVVNVKILQSQDDNYSREVYGVIKGSGGFKAYLDLIPVDETINKGDVLVTSALEGTFPKDHLVGEIIQVDKNDQSPHQQALVQLFSNIETDNLFIISNYKR